MTESIHLSVVIPAYNEEQRLRAHVPAIVAYLTDRPWRFEIVVANDGSHDGTADVIQELQELAQPHAALRIINLPHNRGKGAAVKAGMLAAHGRYVLFTDADQSTPIAEVDKLLAKLERDDCDIAIGSRAVSGADVERPQAWHRELAGKAFGVATRWLCIRGIRDTQCGFKIMKREVAQRVLPHVTSDTAIFDIEMLIVATRAGYRVAELPVRWVHDPDTRIPYNWASALRIWMELFRIRRVQRIGWPLKSRT